MAFSSRSFTPGSKEGLDKTVTYQEEEISRRKAEKDMEEDKNFLDESQIWTFAMLEHLYKDSIMEKIKEIDVKNRNAQLEIENNRKLLQEKITQIKAIKLVKERNDFEMGVAEKLRGVSGELEFIEKAKKIIGDLDDIKLPLVLKNFCDLSQTEKDDVIGDLKETTKLIEELVQLFERSRNNITCTSHTIRIVDQLKTLQTGVQKYQEEESEVTNLLIKCLSLTLGMK